MGLGAVTMMITLLGSIVLVSFSLLAISEGTSKLLQSLMLVQGDPWLASLLLLPMVSVLAWWARESSVYNI